MTFSNLIALLQDAAQPSSGQSTVRIVAGALALVLVIIIIMRRKGSKKKQEDEF